MQTGEQQSDISITFQVLVLKAEKYNLQVSQKLQSKTVDGIHKLFRFFFLTIQIYYIKTTATMNIQIEF